MPNRLALEPSPYLRQHADNPVDWYPWGDEAFEAARRADRPIFLSVGYATCHWCHVMAHESFEDAAIAARLNEHFVAVKLDREERPDVDRVYMAFVQATTRQGGWPMSVWLTPTLEPFFGGTYFPPAARWGRPGFADVLDELARVWAHDRVRVVDAGRAFAEGLREFGVRPSGSGLRGVSPADVAAAVDQFTAMFDADHGGFGTAPKFPRPSELLFLLRGSRAGRREAVAMVSRTLRAMSSGGVRDQIGGGFHRYSVDRAWRVPHFEKMLYDQAQIVLALAEAAVVTGDSYLRDVAADTVTYVLERLTHAGGGFFSAEDADSIPADAVGTSSPHPREGAYYLWTLPDVGEVTGEDADLVTAHYGISPRGNVEHDLHGEFGAGNIPFVAVDADRLATTTGADADDVRARLARGRARLALARTRRPRPLLDDKVLASWNGLMIGACARMARMSPHGWDPEALGSRCRHAAAAAATFVHDRLWRADARRLLRRWRDGHAGIDAFAEDYGTLAWGVLELFQATGTVRWLQWAGDLLDALDDGFVDREGGGWFSTTGRDPAVILRTHDDYDGAEPSATAVAAAAVLVHERLVPSGRRAHLEQTLDRLAWPAGARVAPWLASVAADHLASPVQIAIVGDPGVDGWTDLWDVVAGRFLPQAVVVPVVTSERAGLARLLPWTTSMVTRNGRATAYVCRDFACDAPVDRAGDLDALLDAVAPFDATRR